MPEFYQLFLRVDWPVYMFALSFGVDIMPKYYIKMAGQNFFWRI
jgi:hypothetical protein